MDDRAFGEHLVGYGLVSRSHLENAREAQAMTTGRLDTALLGIGAISEVELLDALGVYLNSRTVGKVELSTIDPLVVRMLPPRVACRFKVVPFRKEGKRISVASMEPLDLLVEDELALLTGSLVKNFIGLEIRVLQSLRRFYGLDLSLQMNSVLRRLRGEITDGFTSRPQRQTSTPAPTPTAARPARPKPAAAPPRPQPPPRPKRVEVVELEIDDDDHELFPSLRGAIDEQAEAEAAPRAAEMPAPAETPAAPAQPPPEVETSSIPESAPAPPQTGQAEAPPPEPQPTPEPVELSAEERLAVAAEDLTAAEMRDDIADAILDFCAPYLRRRMLLVLRKDSIVGWRGEGEGVDETSVRAIAIPTQEPSVFMGLSQGSSFWLGALPPMPRNVDLVLGLGGEHPTECVIIPVAVKTKIVCYLYGDNLDGRVSGVPMGLLRRLINKAGLAFEVYIMKSKIRLM